jgi:hypothetical protein
VVFEGDARVRLLLALHLVLHLPVLASRQRAHDRVDPRRPRGSRRRPTQRGGPFTKLLSDSFRSSPASYASTELRPMTITLLDPRTGKLVTITVPDKRRSS